MSGKAFLVSLLSPSAVIPSRATPGSAGYDICASVLTTLECGQRRLVPTGLQIRVPQGTYGRIAPRSGMAMKHGIDVMAGVIDEDYTGEVMVLLINFGADAMVIHPGERIAQLILEKIESVDLTVVTELPATLRAEGGFGSSGI